MTLPSSPACGPQGPRRRVRLGLVVASLSVLAACILFRYFRGAEAVNAAPPTRSSIRTTPSRAIAPPTTRPQEAVTAGSQTTQVLKVVAMVNGEEISREELARECLTHYGKSVFERLVHKFLIMQECKRQGLTVTQDEVNAEIEQMATRFGLPVQEWLKMLKQERGISATQYASDIIWPSLALRKLAKDQLEVTQEELNQRYESMYGEAIKARLIVCDDEAPANRVRAAAAANPDGFGDLARKESKDAPSASANGLIQPIRRYAGPKNIEDLVFALKEGEVSPVIKVADQYVIVKCEGHLPAVNMPLEKVKPHLVEMLRDSKMRSVANDVFGQLKKTAKIENVMDDPVKRQKMPGVAAMINGSPVEIRELAELCIQRHGEEVLEGTINHRLLEQACKQKKITISEADLDQEIARAAGSMLPSKADGSPDVDKWLEMVQKEQGISVEVYRKDSVWPSVALKKLVGNHVEITDEDLQKGFEANYGPRVRCRAIVFNNLRRAQQVWEMARSKPTVEYFGDLAQQYSVEASSAALRGEVPPVQQHGGQPLLEKEAFKLQKGELSGIIQVGQERYVVLFCEGQTEPVKLRFAEVKDEIYADIHEKKLRLAMGDYFQKLQDSATIDNYLAGSSRSPNGNKAAPPERSSGTASLSGMPTARAATR
ncbi:MAG: peptidylprolyl isomerase [Thermoguttaceae bacterium]